MSGFISNATANRKARTVSIGAGASLSGGIDCLGQTLVGIILPAGWTTATLSFQGSVDGTNWYNIYAASGSEVVTGSFSASSYVALDPADFAGVPQLKVRSGSSSAATNQVSAVSPTLVFRGV